jgi:hypothetical protein
MLSIENNMLDRRSSVKHNDTMLSIDHNKKCPAGLSAGGAFCGKLRPLELGWVVYFNELLIEVNLSLRLVPRPLTAAIMASEIPAAISPYSIAVAPDSSDKNFKKIRCNHASH